MNGHIGFNEPNLPDSEGCIVVDLDETTKSVGRKYFDGEMPASKGITLSCTELKKSRKVIYIAGGEAKADIVKKIVDTPPCSQVPATMLKGHLDLSFYLDEAAAGKLL